MPQAFPSKEVVDAIVRQIATTNPPAALLIGQLFEAARANSDEATAAAQQVRTLQQQLSAGERTLAEAQARFAAADRQAQDKTAQAAKFESDLREITARLTQATSAIDALRASAGSQARDALEKLANAERALSELQIRFTETDRQAQDKIVQAAKLESDLKLATARLAESTTRISELDKIVADLRGRTATSSRPITDLVNELHADAATLFAKPIRPPDAPHAAGVVVDALEFEIRGDLAIGDKVGLRTFSPDRAGPEAASVVRFSLKPEMRIEVPDEDKTK
jgi:hypothetical protein